MLLLACDGLWDVMNNHEAVAKMREILSSGVNDMTLVAEKMLDFSLDRGHTNSYLQLQLEARL